MNWISLASPDIFNSIHRQSVSDASDAFVIFKHSTRCGTSSMAIKQFERHWKGTAPVHLLLVVEDRQLSNMVGSMYNIIHESPQVLVIRNGKCIYNASHSDIDADDVTAALQSE